TISPCSSFDASSMSPRAAPSVSRTPSLEAKRGAECRTVAMLPLNGPFAADLPLQLHHAVEQRFRCRRAAWNVNVHRHDPVAAAHDAIAVVVVAAAVDAAAHAHHAVAW